MAAIYAATSIVLARLLSPEDFGVFALAFVVVGVLDIVQHGGLLMPLVQSRSLTQSQVATLFWFCAAVGVAQAVCGALAAPLVSWLFADARVSAPIVALALGYLTSGLTTTEVAIMRRRMQFERLAVLEVSTVAAAAIVAIVTAWFGAGYWSLVYLQLVRKLLFGVLLLIAAGVPAPRLRFAEIGPLVRFGRVMVAFEAIAFANTKLDNLVVGWFGGPIALGFYAKAYEFFSLINNQVQGPISSVVHSAMSRVQEDARLFRDALSRGLLLNTSLSLPVIVFLAIHAQLVVLVLFGEKWLPAAAIVRALAPGAMTMTLSAGVGWIFVALGRARRQLPWALAASILTVVAFGVGAHWRGLGVAVAFSACRVALLIPTLMFTCHGTPVVWPSIIRSAARPAAACAVAALIGSAAGLTMPSTVASLSVLAGIFAVSYVGCWIAIPGGLALVRREVLLARGRHSHG